MSSSVKHTTYSTGSEIVHTEWIPHPDMRWMETKQIACTVCGLCGQVDRTDTFPGAAKETIAAEKRVYQWFIDRGCPHVKATGGIKHLDVSDIVSGGKSKAKGNGKAGAKK